MKKLFISLAISLAAICVACTSSGDKQCMRQDKSSDFPAVTEAEVDTLEIPLIARVSQILSADSVITIQTEGTPMWVYALNPDNLSVVDSICRKGTGPDEYSNVAISTINGSDDLLVVDNRRMKWYRIAGSGVKESGNTGRFIVSDLHDIDFPLAGYVDFRSDGLRLRIRDFRTGAETDSLLIPNINENGESLVDNFVWNYDSASRRFAIAFNDRNKLIIGRINDGTFDDVSLLAGDSQPNRIYYTDVKVDGDKLLALTQENVNLETYDGHSSIEVYSFEGKPLSKINLPVIAQTITLDNLTSTVYLVSATDDNLYSFPMPTL